MLKTKLKPSKRQQTVYDTWDETKSNLLIESVAGSGKTTVLLELLKKCDDETLFLAFNKSIQQEIEKSIKEGNIEKATSLTLHSLGLSSITRHYAKYEIDKNKYYGYTKYLNNKYPKIFSKMKFSEKSKLNFMLIDMNSISRMFMTDDIAEIKNHMISMDKSICDDPNIPLLWSDLVRLRDRSYSERKVTVDFLDMIFIPTKLKLRIPKKPTYVMIDECQDLNLLQHTFIDQLINQGDVKRWVGVGDKNQSIYGFSGSHSSSFDIFKGKENVVELPLDICYRCPTNIIDEANKIYDVMQPFKTEEGIVDTITDPTLIKDNSMVICRNTGPLFELYFNLVSNNRDASIKGEDVLNKMYAFLTARKFDKIGTIYTRTMAKAKKLKRGSGNFDKFEASQLEEIVNNIEIMVVNGFIGYGDKASDLITKMKRVFRESKSGIVLCTIHKAKGLENDVVYILNDFLMPSKFAKSPTQIEQEYNLKYVARTRAKKELYYLNIIKEKK